MFHIVYQITNLINGKIYIGKHSTENLNDSYMGSSPSLNNAIQKYGKNNFEKIILNHYESSKDAFDAEANIVNEEFIKRKDTYNLRTGGSINVIVSTETRKKIAIAGLNREVSSKTRKKLSESHLNRTNYYLHTEEFKKKIGELNSISQKGEKNSHFGTVWIYNLELKISKSIKKEELEVYIEQGWIKGRKMKF